MSEAMIVFNQPLVPEVSAEAVRLKEAALAGCALIGAITSKEQNAAAVAAVAEVTALRKSIKKAHKEAKEPYLRACQAIDAKRNELDAELEAEELRVNRLAGDYQQAELEKVREAERARQRELDRIEAERLAEERRIAAEAAEKERQRLAEIERVEAARRAEQAKIEQEAAQARTKAAKAEAERKRLALEKERQEAAAKAESERIANAARLEKERVQREALAAQEREAVGPQKELAKTAGQTVKTRWTFEVTNIVDLSKVRPDLVKMEPRTAEINELINTMGVREMRGLRIYEEVKTAVRPGSVGKLIDV